MTKRPDSLLYERRTSYPRASAYLSISCLFCLDACCRCLRPRLGPIMSMFWHHEDAHASEYTTEHKASPLSSVPQALLTLRKWTAWSILKWVHCTTWMPAAYKLTSILGGITMKKDEASLDDHFRFVHTVWESITKKKDTEGKFSRRSVPHANAVISWFTSYCDVHFLHSSLRLDQTRERRLYTRGTLDQTRERRLYTRGTQIWTLQPFNLWHGLSHIRED